MKCPRCNKNFFPEDSDVWVYRAYWNDKGMMKLFCSWHCMREQERENMSKRKAHSKDIQRIYDMVDAGVKLSDIADTLGISIDKARYWRDRHLLAQR